MPTTDLALTTYYAARASACLPIDSAESAIPRFSRAHQSRSRSIGITGRPVLGGGLATCSRRNGWARGPADKAPQGRRSSLAGCSSRAERAALSSPMLPLAAGIISSEDFGAMIALASDRASVLNPTSPAAGMSAACSGCSTGHPICDRAVSRPRCAEPGRRIGHPLCVHRPSPFLQTGSLDERRRFFGSYACRAIRLWALSRLVAADLCA